MPEGFEPLGWLRDPANRVKMAWVILVVSIFAWPATSFTVFSGATPEGQGILGLSWFTVILQAVLLIVTTDVRKKQEDARD